MGSEMCIRDRGHAVHVRFLYGPLWIVRREALTPCDLLDAYRAIEEEIKIVESQAASKIDKLRAEARAAFERALTAGRP